MCIKLPQHGKKKIKLAAFKQKRKKKDPNSA